MGAAGLFAEQSVVSLLHGAEGLAVILHCRNADGVPYRAIGFFNRIEKSSKAGEFIYLHDSDEWDSRPWTVGASGVPVGAVERVELLGVE